MERDTKIVDELSRSVEAAGTEMVDNFPKLIAICKYSHSLLEASLVHQEATDQHAIILLNAAPQGISEIACDGEVDRLSVAQLYNKVNILLPYISQDLSLYARVSHLFFNKFVRMIKIL